MSKSFSKTLFLIILLVTLSGVETRAQNKTIDSLKLALKNAAHDTTRCNILNAMIEAEANVFIWPKYNEELKIVVERNIEKYKSDKYLSGFFKKGLAAYHNNLGYLLNVRGESDKAFEHLEKSIKLLEEIGNKSDLAAACLNTGVVYKDQGQYDNALKYFNKSLQLSIEANEKMAFAYSLNALATLYHVRGEIARAKEFFEKSLKIKKELGDKIGIASTLSNIALVYKEMGNVPKSIEYYIEGLKLQEEIGDNIGLATTLSNLGSVYSDQMEYEKSMELYNKCLKIQESSGDKSGLSTTLSNIADNYKDRGKYTEALFYFNKCLTIQTQVGEMRGVANSLRSIGTIHARKKDFATAISCLHRSLEICADIKDKKGVASAYNQISNVLLKQRKYNDGIEFGKKGLIEAKELGFPGVICNSANTLYKLYKATSNHKLSLEYYELYIQMRDSINNESTRKASVKSQLKYEYEKQAAADSVAHAKESEIKNVELQRQSAEIRAKKNQQYALFGGLGLVMIFAGFMFNRFKVTQKQKGIIELQKFEVEKQKHLVDEKQKEVMDSIRYAQRIQGAQLPSEKMIKKNLVRLMKF